MTPPQAAVSGQHVSISVNPTQPASALPAALSTTESSHGTIISQPPSSRRMLFPRSRPVVKSLVAIKNKYRAMKQAVGQTGNSDNLKDEVASIKSDCHNPNRLLLVELIATEANSMAEDNTKRVDRLDNALRERDEETKEQYKVISLMQSRIDALEEELGVVKRDNAALSERVLGKQTIDALELGKCVEAKKRLSKTLDAHSKMIQTLYESVQDAATAFGMLKQSQEDSERRVFDSVSAMTESVEVLREDLDILKGAQGLDYLNTEDEDAY